ncbi:MAG: RNA polymerase sigma factor [Planctomycetota bacterium]
MASPTHRTVEAVWRIEAPRLIASLCRAVRDVGLAEDLAQEAFVAALEQWPAEGQPDNPAAWLLATARRRGIDRARRDRRLAAIEAELQRAEHRFEPAGADDVERADARLDGGVDDDVLRLVFLTCHPVLSHEARVALTLRLLCGLSTEEIARAFLVPEPTIAQRIVRAKRALAEHRAEFERPQGPALRPRLQAVLAVIYLVFNEGYAATRGADWMRPALCDEAIRLGRVLAAALPDEGEVHGLLALMELQASRTAARTDRDGRPVLLLEQDRARWDQLLIRRGLQALATAVARSELLGPYGLQAAIAACHARARTADATDWPRIEALYERLALLTPSPIVALNGAVATAMARGAQAGLDRLDALADDPQLQRYHLLPAARGDLLARLGRADEARAAFTAAAALCANDRERALLRERAAALESADPGDG